MILAKRCGVKRIIVEIDSEFIYKEIIGVVKEENLRIYPYVKNIQSRKDRFEGFEYVWISRKTNQTGLQNN